MLAIGVPILYILITNPWSKGMWGYTLLLCFILSIAQLVRSNAGIFIWLSLVCIVVYQNIPLLRQAYKTSWVRALPILLGLFVVFSCQGFFTNTVPNAYLVATGQDISQRLDTMGPWHTLYIGLGWRDNPNGIYYDDICGYDQFPELVQDSHSESSIVGSAASDDASVDQYLSLIFLPQTEEYIEAIKGSYLEALTQHPITYAISYLLKVAYAVVMGIRPTLFFGLAFMLFDSALLAMAAGGFVLLAYLAALTYMLRYCLKTQGKAVLKKLLPVCLLGLIALANGLLPAVVAMPTYVYIASVVGAYDISAILLLVVTYLHYRALRKHHGK